jgi:hypothetical protein
MRHIEEFWQIETVGIVFAVVVAVMVVRKVRHEHSRNISVKSTQAPRGDHQKLTTVHVLGIEHQNLGKGTEFSNLPHGKWVEK